MFTIILGLLLIGFCVCACLPQVLGWGPEIIAAIKGIAPVFCALAGLIMIFIGVADIQDKAEARKEEKEAKQDALEEAEKNE